MNFAIVRIGALGATIPFSFARCLAIGRQVIGVVPYPREIGPLAFGRFAPGFSHPCLGKASAAKLLDEKRPRAICDI
jgi:hypothetical protein